VPKSTTSDSRTVCIGFYQAGMTACSSERGRIMAVDAPPALGELLLTAIEEVTDPPCRAMPGQTTLQALPAISGISRDSGRRPKS
jgi:hypothetical protein